MRIGICGLGMMGQAHLANALKIESLEPAALCDSDPERLALSQAVAGNIDLGVRGFSLDAVPRFTEFGRMLAEAELDAVLLALPTYLHAESAVAALEAGLHVFSEKPIALTVADAERMCAAARDAGKVLFIGHVVRFMPAYRELRRRIEGGEYGRVLSAEFGRVCGVPGWGGGSWFTDPARSGGMPLDLHVHDTDYILHVFGAPQDVHAARSCDEETGMDVMRSVFSYENCFVTSCGAWLQRSVRFRAWAAVAFERATVTWHTEDPGRLRVCPAEGEPQTVALPDEDGYEAELREFARCVESGRPSDLAPPESAVTSLATVYREIAAAEAAATGG